jgi:alcohol dehydrogenase (NADP+)
MYLSMLNTNGTLITVGAPPSGAQVSTFSLINNRRNIGGSLIGGIAETQEMLNFCGAYNIVSDVEVIPMSYINEAYDRMLRNDVRYRFVIDMQSL